MPQIPWLILLWILALSGFVVLIFLPALLELRNPKDNGPRKIPETGVERVIEGEREGTSHLEMQSVVEEYVPQDLRRTLIDLDGRRISKPSMDVIRISGDVELPSDIEMREKLVVDGSLTVGDRCNFHRSIEVLNDVKIGSGVVIEENLIVGGIADIGSDTVIKGSVDAKGAVCLGQNVCVWLSLSSGGDVELCENVRVAGNILSSGCIHVLPSLGLRDNRKIIEA